MHSKSNAENTALPAAVRDFRWWAGVKDRYLERISGHLDGFGRASAYPDVGMLKKVRVFDTTARDGMQMPDAFLTEGSGIPVMQNKVEICVELARWGIPIIEVGNAVSSREELEAIRKTKEEVGRLGLDTEIVSLARTAKEDIAAAKESGADVVHIFSSGSIPHAWVKFRKTPEQLIPGIVESIEYARKIGFTKLVFSLEDAARSDPLHLVEVAKRIYGICGDSIHYNIPDTVGAADPAYMFALISYIRSQVPVPLQVHCHNDTGNAANNTIAAMYAGVSEIHTTMHGMGERTGNAPLEVVATNIYARHGVELVDLGQMALISRFIRKRSGVSPAVNAPVVGKDAFWHESGVHANAVHKSSQIGYTKRIGIDGGSIYVAFNPASVGTSEEVGVGPLCGRTNVIARLEKKFGAIVPEDKVAEIVSRVKRMSAGKRVSDADFILMAYETVMEKQCEKVKIERISVTTGTEGRVARVRLKLNGSFGEGTDASGNGPVDVAVNAIRKALHRWSRVRISAYECHGIGEGSNAAARATMTMRKGRVAVETSAVDTDIVLASIEAFRKGYNAMCALEELQEAGRKLQTIKKSSSHKLPLCKLKPKLNSRLLRWPACP